MYIYLVICCLCWSGFRFNGVEDTMDNMDKILNLWDGKELGFKQNAAAVPFPSVPKPMYVQYEGSGRKLFTVEIPSFLQQHKCYGAGRDVSGTIHAIYAGPWEFPFRYYTGDRSLYPVDSHFAFTVRKNLFKIRASFDDVDYPGKLYLTVHSGGDSLMRLVTRAGRDCQALGNLVQVYAGVEPPSGDLLDADDDGWDGVGRFSANIRY